jgi:hypothetical protein
MSDLSQTEHVATTDRVLRIRSQPFYRPKP